MQIVGIVLPPMYRARFSWQ